MARNLGWAARLGRALPAALAFSFASLFSPPAFGQDLTAAREDFRKGVDLFEQGKYGEARESFDKVLAANPGSDTALEMRNEAGYQVFVEMLQRKDELATIARKLLELAEKGTTRDRQDPEKIQQLIQTMFSSEDEEASFRALNELASQVGPFAVPFMVDYLAERRDTDKRVKAIDLLVRMGPDGTNAIVELLKHKDDFVRQNAAAILGHARDFKSIPYLKAAAERRGESGHVQDEARRALKKITGKEASGLDPAAVYFHALAERYYQEDTSVMINNFKDWTVWEWKDEKLQSRFVPRWSWNEEMAEDCCYEAIELTASTEVREGDLDQVMTLLVNVFFQAGVESQELAQLAEEKAAGGGVDPADLEALKTAQQKLAALPVLASSRGETQVLKALRKALRDRRVPVAVAMIEKLRDLGMSESLLPADGSNLSTYIEGGKAKAVDLSPRPPEPAAPAKTAEPKAPAAQPKTEPTAPAPAPAPAKKEPEPEPEPAPAPAEEKPAAEPEKKPEGPKQPPGGSRRRRISQGETADDGAELALEQPYDEPETLRTLQSAGEAHGAALAAALTYEDKRVRYAASEALLRLAPTRKFASSAKVVENLSAALGESGSRVVLIAARDVQVRNRLSGLVRDLHHLPFSVPMAREAIVRARSSPSEDVILIHTETNPPGEADDFTVAEFIEQVNVDYRTVGTPVIVMTPRRLLEANEKNYGDKAKAVLPDDVDPVMLKDKLESLWAGADAKRDPKAKAISVARSAAEALAAADPRTSIFDLKLTIPALMQAVEVQPDAVRVPALRALGKLRARESVDKVAAVFDNPQNSKEVRVAAAYAVGEALRGTPIPSKVFESLKAALKEGDPELYRSAAEALGKPILTRDQAREVLVEQRVE